MSSDNQLAVAQPLVKASTQLSVALGIEPGMMIETIKKQCFPGMNPDNVSDAQLAAFISVANNLGLNPLIPGFLYAYPSKNGGLVPVMGPDGVFKKLDEHVDSGKLAGYECVVYPEDMTQPPTHAVAKIFRPNNDHPSTYTAIFKEWSVASNPNWASRPRHMLFVRALKQCARQVIHGLPFDEDERRIAEMIDVTPHDQPKRDAAPPPVSGVAAALASEGEKKRGPGRPRKDEPKVVEGEIVEAKTATESAKEAPKAESLSRNSLAAGERFNAICTVKSVKADMVKKGGQEQPSIIAELEGQFQGKVYALNQAPVKDGVPQVPEEWTAGKPLAFELVGDARKAKPDPKFPNDRTKDIPMPCTVLALTVKIADEQPQEDNSVD